METYIHLAQYLLISVFGYTTFCLYLDNKSLKKQLITVKNNETKLFEAVMDLANIPVDKVDVLSELTQKVEELTNENYNFSRTTRHRIIPPTYDKYPLIPTGITELKTENDHFSLENDRLKEVEKTLIHENVLLKQKLTEIEPSYIETIALLEGAIMLHKESIGVLTTVNSNQDSQIKFLKGTINDIKKQLYTLHLKIAVEQRKIPIIMITLGELYQLWNTDNSYIVEMSGYLNFINKCNPIFAVYKQDCIIKDFLPTGNLFVSKNWKPLKSAQTMSMVADIKNHDIAEQLYTECQNKSLTVKGLKEYIKELRSTKTE